MSNSENSEDKKPANLAEVFEDIKKAAEQFDVTKVVMEKVMKIALQKEQAKVKELEAEVENLQEENKSLWWMLDEIKQSQTWTKEHTEELQKSIDQQMLTYRLMQLRKGEA